MRSYISAVSIRRLFQANGESRLKENKNLVRARRYAKGTFAQEFGEICREIDRIFHQRMEEAEARDAEIQEQIREEYESFLEKAERLAAEKSRKAKERREADYLAACEKQEKAKSPDDFRSAAEDFEKIGTYKDCAVRTEECRKREEERRTEEERIRKEAALREEKLRKQKAEKAAIIVSAVAVIAISAFLVNERIIQPSIKYEEAQSLLAKGSYDEAYSAFDELLGYKDVDEDFLKDIKYEKAQSLLAEGSYDEAYSVFGELLGYRDVNGDFLNDIENEEEYEKAQSLLAEGSYDEAYSAFGELLGYKDVDENFLKEIKYEEAQSLISESNYADAFLILNDLRGYKDVNELLGIGDPEYSIGSEVVFGSYEQDGNTANGPEDIEWIILARAGDNALLLSKYGLDAKQYNEWEVVTWEQSDIRSWLNSSFMDTAFTDEEQGAILKTEVDNSKAEGYSYTTGGNNTEDRVFLLSYKEVFEDYFSSDEERICMPTDYVVQNEAWTDDETGACYWWLRSPDSNHYYVARVIGDGSLSHIGVDIDQNCVRPALWINLESGIF